MIEWDVKVIKHQTGQGPLYIRALSKINLNHFPKVNHASCLSSESSSDEDKDQDSLLKSSVYTVDNGKLPKKPKWLHPIPVPPCKIHVPQIMILHICLWLCKILQVIVGSRMKKYHLKTTLRSLCHALSATVFFCQLLSKFMQITAWI